MATKQQAQAAMERIGACWAVTARKCILPGDGYDATPSYHVHPDASYPHEGAIRRFSSYAEIVEWAQEAEAASEREAAHEAAHEAEMMRRYGER